MRLTHLHCRAFRCLDEIDLAPAPGLNVIRGNNAQGKTSILEAIYYAATARSHRTNADPELVEYGKEAFHVTMRAQRRDREATIEASWWKGAKRFKLNGVAQLRLSDILGKINVVLFTPEDLELIKGGAAERRRYLDVELSQLSPAYLAALQSYRHALRQRNELLRKGNPDDAQMDVWDKQLAAHGELVIAERAAGISELSGYARDSYENIARHEPMSLAYDPNVVPGERFDEVLRKARQTDIRRGMTTHGPHRDDIKILVGGHPARSHASQGQQKSAALAMKLAGLELIHRRTGEYPILMLDEVLSELDDDRAARLFTGIDESVQCIVTTTELDGRRQPFTRDATEFRISQGRIENS